MQLPGLGTQLGRRYSEPRPLGDMEKVGGRVTKPPAIPWVESPIPIGPWATNFLMSPNPGHFLFIVDGLLSSVLVSTVDHALLYPLPVTKQSQPPWQLAHPVQTCPVFISSVTSPLALFSDFILLANGIMLVPSCLFLCKRSLESQIHTAA